MQTLTTIYNIHTFSLFFDTPCISGFHCKANTDVIDTGVIFPKNLGQSPRLILFIQKTMVAKGITGDVSGLNDC